MDAKPRLRHDKSRPNLQLTVAEDPRKTLSLSSPQLLSAPFKTYLKHKTVRLVSEEDCPLCQQHVKLKNMPKLVHKALFSKYSNSITYFFTKGVNDILAGNKSRALTEFVEDSYWMPDKECIVGFVPLHTFKERFDNLWKYHQFNIDQPRHDCRGISSIAEKYFNGKRKIQEKAIKKMLEVMTDSELEACEIHLSQFASQPLEIVEKPIDESERIVPKALTGERKASSISLSIIENISKGGKHVKPEDYLRHQIFRAPQNYMVFDWGEKDQFTDISKLFQTNKKNSFFLSDGDWPSFIEPSEKRKLNELVEDRSESRIPQRLLKLDKNFSKKAYKEVVHTLPDQSKSKSKSKKVGGISGLSARSNNILPLGIKSKQKRDLVKFEKVSREKELKKSGHDYPVEESSFPPCRHIIPAAPKQLKIKETVLSELKKSSVNQAALTLAIKGKRKEVPTDLTTPVRKLMSTLKNNMKASLENNKKAKPATKSTQKSVSRSRSIKNSVEPKTKVVLPESIKKCASSDRKTKTTLNLGKKTKDLKQAPLTLRENSSSTQKQSKPLFESSSVKSLGVTSRRFDSSAKRLKTRPLLTQENTNVKTSSTFIGYDPFVQATMQSSSPRELAYSGVKKTPMVDSSKINIYSAGFMHKIILSKRNQLSETKMSSSDLKLPHEQIGASLTSRPRLRHGSSGNHTLQMSSNQLLRQQTGRSPPNASPRSLSRHR